MMKKLIRLSLVAAAACLLSSGAGAAVKVGDKPSFKVESLDGTPLSLEQYRGKIVIIDFWATWCGPCMAEAEHMVQLHKDYGPKGVQLIGISLDSDKSKLESVVKAKRFDWPQFFDGQGWGNELAVEWGVKSIPATFILDPEGNVVWKGHPAQIDAALANAMAKTPPMAIDPAIARDAKAKLDEIDTLLIDAPEKALGLLMAVPQEARKLPDLDKRIGEIEIALEEVAGKLVADAAALQGEGKFEEAFGKLNTVATAMPTTTIGKTAAANRAALEKDPKYIEQKAAAEKAKAEAARSAEADAALKEAQALAAKNRHEDAYAAYKSLARRYEGTPAATQATAAVASYEKDAAFVRRVNDKAAKERAEGMLSLARNYARTNVDTAKRKYKEVIATFPNTSYAETAKRELAELEAKSKKK